MTIENSLFYAVINFVSWFLMIVGILFCFIGIIGMFRMPDLFSKQHAAGLVDTMGYLCITLSLALHSGISIVTLKVLLLGFLAIFLSAPICNALVKSAVINKILPKSTNKD